MAAWVTDMAVSSLLGLLRPAEDNGIGMPVASLTAGDIIFSALNSSLEAYQADNGASVGDLSIGAIVAGDLTADGQTLKDSPLRQTLKSVLVAGFTQYAAARNIASADYSAIADGLLAT